MKLLKKAIHPVNAANHEERICYGIFAAGIFLYGYNTNKIGEFFMDNKISVLVIDDDEMILKELSAYINNQDDMVAKTASNGEEAYLKIIKNKPNIIVLDLIMPWLDGNGLLKKLQKNKPTYLPKIILYSASPTTMDFVLAANKEMIINGGLLKPQSGKKICQIIRNIMKNPESVRFFIKHSEIEKQAEKDIRLEKAVIKFLTGIGISENLKGFYYCKTAITMIYKHQNYKITSKIYPKIAVIYGTTPSLVERSIRYAIKLAWANRDNEFITKYFFAASWRRGSYRQPTNGEFISTAADRIRLELIKEGEKSYV